MVGIDAEIIHKQIDRLAAETAKRSTGDMAETVALLAWYDYKHMSETSGTPFRACDGWACTIHTELYGERKVAAFVAKQENLATHYIGE